MPKEIEPSKANLIEVLGATGKRLEEELDDVFKIAKTPKSRDGKNAKEHVVQIGKRTYVFHTWKLDKDMINHITIREDGKAETIRFFRDGTMAITEGEREAGDAKVIFSSHGNGLSACSGDDLSDVVTKLASYHNDIGPWIEQSATLLHKHTTRGALAAIGVIPEEA